MRTMAQYYIPVKSSTTRFGRPPSFEVFASVCGTCHIDSTGVGVAGHEKHEHCQWHKVYSEETHSKVIRIYEMFENNQNAVSSGMRRCKRIQRGNAV